jgi:hypothetical protein
MTQRDPVFGMEHDREEVVRIAGLRAMGTLIRRCR